MVDGYGSQESIDACDRKLQGSRVTTPKENGDIYNTLNDAWLDMEDERKKYNYASIVKVIEEEAKQTRKVPNIAAIIQANRKIQEINNEKEQEMEI